MVGISKIPMKQGSADRDNLGRFIKGRKVPIGWNVESKMRKV